MLANEQQNNFKNISAACSNFANPFYKDIKTNELQITNTAYIQEEIEIIDDFLPIYKNNFISLLVKVDFRNDTHAAKIINLLIRGITNNKMSDVMFPDGYTFLMKRIQNNKYFTLLQQKNILCRQCSKIQYINMA